MPQSTLAKGARKQAFNQAPSVHETKTTRLRAAQQKAKEDKAARFQDKESFHTERPSTQTSMQAQKALHMGNVEVGTLDGEAFATEPNETNDLSPFELPDDDNDELLTVDLSPAAGRKRSKSQRMDKQLAN